jgi:hypothetical protein
MSNRCEWCGKIIEDKYDKCEDCQKIEDKHDEELMKKKEGD